MEKTTSSPTPTVVDTLPEDKMTTTAVPPSIHSKVDRQPELEVDKLDIGTTLQKHNHALAQLGTVRKHVLLFIFAVVSPCSLPYRPNAGTKTNGIRQLLSISAMYPE